MIYSLQIYFMLFMSYSFLGWCIEVILKFRRTLATKAIDKEMPIEQVQHLLGHTKIDTTLHYAFVNQNNVKISHRKYIC